MNHDEPFFQVPRTAHATSQGPVELPILYSRVDVAYAFFRTSVEAVAELLTDTGLEPTPYSSTHSLVGVACFAYHETTVGPYNEVGVVVPTIPSGHKAPLGGLAELLRTRSHPDERQAGFHVLHLPVTTEVANAGGRELWGYPKFVTDIEMALDRQTLSCRVDDPDGAGTIMRLAGRLGWGIPTPSLSLVTYSVLDGDLLRTTVDARGGMRAHRGRGMSLMLGSSLHPMAATLEALGLDGASPVAVLTSDAFKSRLNAGAPIRTTLHRVQTS